MDALPEQDLAVGERLFKFDDQHPHTRDFGRGYAGVFLLKQKNFLNKLYKNSFIKGVQNNTCNQYISIILYK